MPGTLNKKMLIIGDGECGKTSMLDRFFKNKFAETYTPTDVESYPVNFRYKEHMVELEVWDCGDSWSNLQYNHMTDVILLCFSLDKLDGFKNIEYIWSPRINEKCPKVPVVLVGSKKDLRNNKKRKRMSIFGCKPSITSECGERLAHDIGAYAYRECSALLNEGLKEVFETVVQATLQA